MAVDSRDFIYFYFYLLYSNMILRAFNTFLVMLRLQYLWRTDIKSKKMT